ncbi:hypothetical protein KCU88_g5082, partial [Aureobasidium melanogenum]
MTTTQAPLEPLSQEELTKLATLAIEAKECAYCPYSNFRVGACVLLSTGTYHTGSNVEVASTPVGICAERCAIAPIVASLKRPEMPIIRAIAVSTDINPPSSPCGMCRQFINEFATTEDLPIYMLGKDGLAGDVVCMTIGQLAYEMNDMHDFGFGMVLQQQHQQHSGLSSTTPTESLLEPKDAESPHKKHSTFNHKRHESTYDGSDYGPESDVEAEGQDEDSSSLPPILRKRIRDIENLTRLSMNPEDALGEDGGVVKRTIQGLKDLGPQGNIEYGVTRLITAYTSMASHRTHKTRDLFTQSHSLMYGASMLQLPEEMIDLLSDEINALTDTLPFLRPQNPLLSLQILASQTQELGQTLRSLTDLLQESRLVANAATRKLKSVRDMVGDMTLEDELVQNSILLIQAGDWDRRCRTRQAAKTCQEVCEGFATRWGLDVDVDLTNPNRNPPQKPPSEVAVPG